MSLITHNARKTPKIATMNGSVREIGAAWLPAAGPAMGKSLARPLLIGGQPPHWQYQAGARRHWEYKGLRLYPVPFREQ